MGNGDVVHLLIPVDFYASLLTYCVWDVQDGDSYTDEPDEVTCRSCIEAIQVVYEFGDEPDEVDF